jgi:hypothetical protein
MIDKLCNLSVKCINNYLIKGNKFLYIVKKNSIQLSFNFIYIFMYKVGIHNIILSRIIE